MKTIISTLIIVSSLVLFACSNSASESTTEANDSQQEIAAAELYKTMCVACHGMDGKLQFAGAKDLSISTIPLEERIHQITYGKGAMNAFEGILTEDEIKRVAIYIEDLRQ